MFFQETASIPASSKKAEKNQNVTWNGHFLKHLLARFRQGAWFETFHMGDGGVSPQVEDLHNMPLNVACNLFDP